ncbi:MAG TPA: RNA repair transcriptional activator RtcR family protein [Pyrinomonadaceae bacterium]|nr:RNA repair transcriptional activator RtcR family protein [Pyrinomonadaceae bacterium]
MIKSNVVFGVLGTGKDKRSEENNEQDKWRPTVDLCLHDDFPIDRYELLYQKKHVQLAEEVKADIESRTDTKVCLNEMDYHGDPWKFDYVYSVLFDFFRPYKFDNENEDYFVNISTGTHVMQICLFLLAEARYIPAKLVQSTRDKQRKEIDLELEKYDLIAQRFRKQDQDDAAYLKGHIETKNTEYDALIERILSVSTFHYPILLTGSTGVGKSTLAKRIHGLRTDKKLSRDEFQAVNCATLRGDVVRSELFGHKKGAFTGASEDREGLLELANKGTLFLDEIGELDLEVQKMILTAIEEKEFRRLGDSQMIKSDFYLIAGTNSDLRKRVRNREFREDLLARIDAFHFHIPNLKDRAEDIEPNLDRELQEFSRANNINATINDKAKEKYLAFAKSDEATWNNNFRDLKSSVIRMSAFAKNGRITQKIVDEEIDCLRERWREIDQEHDRFHLVRKFMGDEALKDHDLAELAKLEQVLDTCIRSSTRADAGRKLFHVSRQRKKSENDTTRLNNYLKDKGLDWNILKASPCA